MSMIGIPEKGILSEGYGLEPLYVDRLFLLVWRVTPGWGNITARQV